MTDIHRHIDRNGNPRYYSDRARSWGLDLGPGGANNGQIFRIGSFSFGTQGIKYQNGESAVIAGGNGILYDQSGFQIGSNGQGIFSRGGNVGFGNPVFGQRPVFGNGQPGFAGGYHGYTGNPYGQQQNNHGSVLKERSMDIQRGAGKIKIDFVGERIDKDDPYIAIRAALEAQRSSQAFGAPSQNATEVDYIANTEVLGFNGKPPSTEDMQAFLAEKLSVVAARSEVRAGDLLVEMRRQFGDSFAKEVAGNTTGLSATTLQQAMADTLALETKATSTQKQQPKVDAEAVARVNTITEALKAIDTPANEVNGPVASKALMSAVYASLSDAQLVQLRNELEAKLKDPNAALSDASVKAISEANTQLVTDLSTVDPATRDAFFAELEKDSTMLAEQLRAQVNTTQKQQQTETTVARNNLLNKEELDSIRFNDPNIQRDFEAASRTYQSIAGMPVVGPIINPVVGPIINMFLESFGMGPHSIIRENTENIISISEAALTRIGDEKNPVRAAIADNPGLKIYTDKQPAEGALPGVAATSTPNTEQTLSTETAEITVKSAAQTVKVAAGDTLGKIAAKYEGVTWEQIYAANKETIGASPNVIKEGTELNIPGTEKETKIGVRSQADIQAIGAVKITETDTLNAEQEKALATSLGVADKNLNEKQLTEAAMFVATSTDKLSVDQVKDGISAEELSTIQQVMNSDLGAAISKALNGQGITYDGIAETAEMQSVGNAAREAAKGASL
jgi:LysM repeat protein